MRESLYWILFGAGAMIVLIVIYDIFVDEIRESIMRELEKGGKKI